MVLELLSSHVGLTPNLRTNLLLLGLLVLYQEKGGRYGILKEAFSIQVVSALGRTAYG